MLVKLTFNFLLRLTSPTPPLKAPGSILIHNAHISRFSQFLMEKTKCPLFPRPVSLQNESDLHWKNRLTPAWISTLHCWSTVVGYPAWSPNLDNLICSHLVWGNIQILRNRTLTSETRTWKSCRSGSKDRTRLKSKGEFISPSFPVLLYCLNLASGVNCAWRVCWVIWDTTPPRCAWLYTRKPLGHILSQVWWCHHPACFGSRQ